MKKYFLLCTILFFLSGCSQYSAMLGPSITLVETGSVLQATTSYGKSYTLSLARKNISEEKKLKRFVQHIIAQIYLKYSLRHKKETIVSLIQ